MKALNNDLYKNFTTEAFSKLIHDEELTIGFSGETSLFTRFSKAKVRQVSQVNQANMEMKLIKGNKTITFSMNYIGDFERDIINFQNNLKAARGFIAGISEDPYLVRPVNAGNSFEENLPPFPTDEKMILDILKFSENVDLAGLFSSGSMVRANSNSKGQTHWFKTSNYSLDYSLYNDRQKAVKSLYAGNNWNEVDLKNNLQDSITKLNLMNRDSKKVARGVHRVYFAPSAVSELIDTLSWGGLSMGAHQKGQGSFKKLWEKKEQLSKKFNLAEDFSIGLTPRFNDSGEVSPAFLPLIENGELKSFLISSRTANEYKLNTNYASDWESLRSPVLQTGKISREKILSELGTGLYISDLHYINWSDRESARITGMTRYACFWVENGEIVSPIEDLRFDESYYNFFGNALIDLTDFHEINPSTQTYYERSIGGSKTPGILVSDFKFTL